MLSLDVKLPPGPLPKEHNSYFLWIVGKPPEVVFEFVSDRRGGEESHKKSRYASIGVRYYVVFDPDRRLRGDMLRCYELGEDGAYRKRSDQWFPEIGLGVKLWTGAYEFMDEEWLRWHDRRGRLIATSAELAERAKRQADDAKRQADDAKRQADDAKRQADEAKRQADRERRRRERLEARLRDLGIEPLENE
jgi:hypothetical protein